MFNIKKKEFKTEAELQRYIDLKIINTMNSLQRNSSFDVRHRIEDLKAENNKLNERIVHLEKFLGIEFGTETVTGYRKVRKTKTK